MRYLFPYRFLLIVPNLLCRLGLDVIKAQKIEREVTEVLSLTLVQSAPFSDEGIMKVSLGTQHSAVITGEKQIATISNSFEILKLHVVLECFRVCDLIFY